MNKSSPQFVPFRVLSIDASINNVGWCLFTLPDIDMRNPPRGVVWRHIKKKAWRWGTIYPEGSSLEERILDICQSLKSECGDFDFLVTEKPAFYSSERGQIAAHQNYTIDLAAVNYYVAGWFGKDHRTHKPFRAATWKGSVPKAITQRKFFKSFNMKFSDLNRQLTEHAVDATMMLYHFLKHDIMARVASVPHIERELLLRLL